GPLEAEGMARGRGAIAAADLCLWLVDASAPPVLPPPGLERTQLVVNKIDLPPAWPLDEVPAVCVSAQTGAGLAELCEVLVSRSGVWSLTPAAGTGHTPAPAVCFMSRLSSCTASLAAATPAASPADGSSSSRLPALARAS